MCRIVVVSGYVLGLIASPPAVAGQVDVVLLSAKVITADPKQPTAEAVALAGDRIRAVGANDEIRRLAGPNTRVVDLRGRTIIPGLMDAHVHLLTSGGPLDERSLRDYERTVLPHVMTGLISRGITTIRSTGDPLPYIAELRERLERIELVGPRLLITGPALSAPGGHPATTIFRNNPFLRRLGAELASEAHARQVVQEIARAKVDAVKVVVDDIIVNVPPLSDAVLAAVIDEAHRAGVRCIAHLSVTNGMATAKRLIDLGLDEFVHPPLLAQGSDLSGSVEASALAAPLAKRTIPVTTTLSVSDAFRDANGSERGITGGPYTPATRERFERQSNTVRRFSEAGVKLVVGTDWATRYSALGDPRLQPGATTLHEMELLRRAGLSTPAILTAATRNAGEALGIIDKVGTLAEGKLADLVVLDGDLLQDFSALHRTVAVLKEGRIVHGALPER